MDKNSLPESTIDRIAKLLSATEKTFGKSIATPKDFVCLAESIYNVTAITISPTTLKRLWGYITGPQAPRESTLNILARYCGWKDFQSFSITRNPEDESGNIGSTVLSSKDFKPGDSLRLMWNPGRICLIQYLGADRWIVKESLLTKLSPGDTFYCPIFIEGEPLYLNNLVQGIQKPRAYICGRKSGISFIKM